MEEQLSHLKRALNRENKVRYLAIASGKGGVGKTLITINIANILKRLNKKVLIIDGDLGLSNVHIMLGLTPTKNIYDFIEGKSSLEEVIFKIDNNISFISSGSGIKELINMPYQQLYSLISRIHEYASNNFDIVIFDTSPGIHKETTVITSSCDIPIILSTPEPTAVADAYALIKVLSSDMLMRDFFIVINKASSKEEGLKVFNSIKVVADRFLKINLIYAGHISYNKNMIKKVIEQNPFDDQLEKEIESILANLPIEVCIEPRKENFLDKFLSLIRRR